MGQKPLSRCQIVTTKSQLALAADLATRHEASIYVLLQGPEPSAIGRLREKADALLVKRRRQVRYLSLLQADAETLARAVARAKGDLLVVDASNDLLDRQTLWRSLGTLHCPVLIVR